MKRILIKSNNPVNAENHMFNIRKNKLRILLIWMILSIAVLIKVMYEEERNYAVYINDRFIAYFHGKSEAKKQYRSTLEYLSQQYKNVDVKKARIQFKSIKEKNISLSRESDIKENIFKSLEGSVSAKKLYIGSNEIGYVSSGKEKDRILELLSDMYIKYINVDRNKIQRIDISGEINLKDMIADISQIESDETLAEKIYLLDKNSRKPLVRVSLVIKDLFKEEISPSTNIIQTKDLYWGESRMVQGKEGEKEVLKSCVYENGKIISEEKVSEKVISKPIDNIIYTGIKDPVSNQVAFLDYPSRGGITSSFGYRWGKTHHGLDIAGKIGDPISAAFEGRVAYTGYNDVYGNMIIIDHGKGIKTVYGQCSKVLVKAEQKIKKGEVIGKIGSTGRSTGPHLHFELRINDQAVNPVKYLIEK